MSNISRTISYLKRNGIRETAKAVLERTDRGGMDEMLRIAADYTGRTTPVSSETLSEERLCFSILVPAYETEPVYLKQMIDSVLTQTYRNLQLIIADASATEGVHDVVASYQDQRLVYHRISENKGISDNTNEALRLANGDYIGLLDHDDVLEPDALYHIAQKIQTDGCDMVYTDEDKMAADGGNFFEPNFKPDFNLDYLLTNNYICHFTVIRADIVKELGLRSEYDGAQDYDLFLRSVLWIGRRTEETEALRFPQGEMQKRIGHIPQVLYHWRAHERSTADNPESKRYAYEAGKRCLGDFLDSVGWQAVVFHTKHLGFYEVAYLPDLFAVRRDVAAVGTLVSKGNRVIKGPILDGKELFVGMKPSYSGYLHRASLSLDVESLPEETVIRRSRNGETPSDEAEDRPDGVRSGRLVYLPPAQYRKIMQNSNKKS